MMVEKANLHVSCISAACNNFPLLSEEPPSAVYSQQSLQCHSAMHHRSTCTCNINKTYQCNMWIDKSCVHSLMNMQNPPAFCTFGD